MREFACQNSMLKGQYRQTLFWPELWAPCGGGKGFYKTPKKCFHEILSCSCLSFFFFFFRHSNEKNCSGASDLSCRVGKPTMETRVSSQMRAGVGQHPPHQVSLPGQPPPPLWGPVTVAWGPQLVWFCTSCGLPRLAFLSWAGSP